MARAAMEGGRSARLRTVDLEARVRRSAKTEAAYRRRREIIAVGKAIRAMREEAGYSQTALAGKVGTTQSHISDLERGSGRDGPSMTLYFRIMRACGSDTAHVRLVDDSVEITGTAPTPVRRRPAPSPVRRTPTPADIAAAAVLSVLPWLPVAAAGPIDLAACVRLWASGSDLREGLLRRFRESSISEMPAVVAAELPSASGPAGVTGSLAEALARYDAVTFRDVVTWETARRRGAAYGVPWAQAHRIVDAMGLAGSWNSVIARMEGEELRRARIALEMTSLGALTRVEVVGSPAEAQRQFRKSGRRTAFQVFA